MTSNLRIAGTLAISAAVWGLLPAPLAAAPPARPKVGVRFAIEGDTTYLRLAPRPEVKSTVLGVVAETAGNRWSFLEWSSAETGTVAAVWNVRLIIEPGMVKDRQGNTYRDAKVLLHHSGSISGTAWAADFVPSGDEDLLYGLSERKPLSISRLTDDLKAALARQLTTLLGSPNVVSFVKGIPIAEKLIADPDAERLVVPVDRLVLRADLRSQLRVILPSERQRDLLLQLEMMREVADGSNLDACIVTSIIWCNAAEVDGPLPSTWDDDLPRLVAEAKAIRVFMEDYRPNLAGGAVVFDGIVLPEAAGRRCAIPEVVP